MVMIIVEGLKGIESHFKSRQGRKYHQSWIMVRSHQEVASQTDYIFATNHQTFLNVGVRDNHNNYDHYIVLG